MFGGLRVGVLGLKLELEEGKMSYRRNKISTISSYKKFFCTFVWI